MVHIKRINEMATVMPNYQKYDGNTLVWRNHNIAIVSDDNDFMTISIDGKPFKIEKTDDNTFNNASHEVYYKYRGKEITIENASFIIRNGFAEFIGCDNMIDEDGDDLDLQAQEQVKKQFGGFQFPKLEEILTNKKLLDIATYYAEEELNEVFVLDDTKTLEQTEPNSVIAKIGYFFEGFFFSGEKLKTVRKNAVMPR